MFDEFYGLIVSFLDWFVFSLNFLNLGMQFPYTVSLYSFTCECKIYMNIQYVFSQDIFLVISYEKIHQFTKSAGFDPTKSSQT